MHRKLRFLILAGIELVIGALVLRNVRTHAPVQPGTPQEFWMVTCGIDVDGTMDDFDYFGGMYPPQDDWAIYYIQGYHDQFLHRVRLSELAPDLPKVERELRNEASNSEMRRWLAGYSRVWTPQGDDENEVRRLLGLMRISYLTYTKCLDEEMYGRIIDDEQTFIQRWQRANHYWVTVLFEFAWLSIVFIFAAFPWIRGSGRLAWAAHLGLAIPLLFVPFFLGYAPYTFTSAFPAGGVLYPYVIRLFHNFPVFGADVWLLEHAPQPFEQLTQEPGPMLALTGMGLAGPISMCTLGLGVFAGVYVFATAAKYANAKLLPAHKGDEAR